MWARNRKKGALKRWRLKCCKANDSEDARNNRERPDGPCCAKDGDDDGEARERALQYGDGRSSPKKCHQHSLYVPAWMLQYVLCIEDAHSRFSSSAVIQGASHLSRTTPHCLLTLLDVLSLSFFRRYYYYCFSSRCTTNLLTSLGFVPDGWMLLKSTFTIFGHKEVQRGGGDFVIFSTVATTASARSPGLLFIARQAWHGIIINEDRIRCSLLYNAHFQNKCIQRRCTVEDPYVCEYMCVPNA